MPTDKPSILVVGTTGRVGRALVPLLDRDFAITDVSRADTRLWAAENPGDVPFNAEALLNLAGQAHLPRHGTTDTKRLIESNVELPRWLASFASAHEKRLVHLSSTKAAKPRSSPYGFSKLAGEQAIRAIFEAATTAHGSARIVRTPAVLAPPYDAGRLGSLSRFSHLHPAVPPIRVPVVTVGELYKVIRRSLTDSAPRTLETIEIPRSSLSNLRSALESVREQRKR